MDCLAAFLPSVVLFLALIPSQAQESAAGTKAPASTYADSDAGLKQQLADTIQAVNSKDTEREATLIQTLVIGDESTWFRDEFGPAFGPRLGSAYRKMKPTLRQDIQRVYEGNAQLGWSQPKIFRYADAATVDSPIDNYLNCMENVAPLYQTAFDGDRTAYRFAPAPDGSGSRVVAGDLPGYYVYADGAFRFVPQEVFQMLPKQRPIRIRLDMNVMRSKITNDTGTRLSRETMAAVLNTHRAGKVVIHFVLDVDGKMKEIAATEGAPALAEPFLQQAKQWTFQPTTLDGDRVEVEFDWETGFMVNGKH
jgi:hypothetical protein